MASVRARHVAKNWRARFGLAQQKDCYLAFARLVCEAQPQVVGWLQRKFFADGSERSVFGAALDFGLKRDIASRMLKCPSTLENSPFLEFALKRLASGHWLDRVIFCVPWPFGKAQTTILELQDHFAASNYLRRKIKSAEQFYAKTRDWSKLIASAGESNAIDADKVTKASSLGKRKMLDCRYTVFRERMNTSTVWIALELLLRTLASVHASPLLLSMPIAGDLYDREGVSRSARETYYIKLRALVERYHFRLVEFKEHDEDPGFLYRHQSHLTVKGWILRSRA